MTKKAALRFAGFGDEWNEVKLGEVTDIKTGGRDVQDSVEDGLYPFYIRSEEVKRINSYSFDGEAILIPGEGRLGEIFHYANGKFDVHQRVYKISNFTDVNAKFVLQQMKKDFKQHAMRNTVKATVDSLRLPTIQSFTVFVSSLPEQTAIGSFFQDIDQLISLQQRKLEVLKEQKKTYLKLLFPAKGQTKPALRFAGFEDDWKEVKLGEIGVTKSGVGFPDSEQGGVKGIPFYKVSDMNNIGNEIEMVTSNNYVTQDQIDSRKWKVIDTVPAIMFAKVGAALLLNRKRLIREPFLIDNNTMVYIPSVYWDVMFCKILFDTLNLSKYSQVGALPSYNGSDIEAIQVSIPTLPEQEAIGSFFQDLDKAIAKQEEKVNQLKESKQTLLKKMFI